MMNIAVSTFVALVQALMPLLVKGDAPSALVEAILAGLLQLAPQLDSLGANLITALKNIVSDWQASGNLTDAQMAAMDDFDARCDAAFEAAAKAAGV